MFNFMLSNISTNNKEIITAFSSNLFFSNGTITNLSSQLISSPFVTIINCEMLASYFNSDHFDKNLIYSTKSSMNIENSIIFGNIKVISTGIISDLNKLLNISNSTFGYLLNSNGGAIQNIKTNFFLSFSNFIKNEALNGGSIYTQNANISFVQNLFINNSATYGASIYFLSEGIELDLIIKKNNFSLGKGIIAGGAFYSTYCIPDYEGNYFLNNTAQYGENYASPPHSLFLNINENLAKELREYLPSSTFKEKLIFKLKDIYNNTINVKSNDKATLSLLKTALYTSYNFTDESLNNKQLFGKILSDYSNGSFIFEEININFKPKSYILLKINSNLIEKFSPKASHYNFPHFFYSGDYNYLLKIISKECPIGIYF